MDLVNDRNDPGGNVEDKLEMSCCRGKTKRLKSDEKGDDRCASPRMEGSQPDSWNNEWSKQKEKEVKAIFKENSHLKKRP